MRTTVLVSLMSCFAAIRPGFAAALSVILAAGATFVCRDANGQGPNDRYYRFEEGVAGSAATGAGSIVDSIWGSPDGTPDFDPVYSSDVPLAVIPLTGEANTLSLTFGGFRTVLFNSMFLLHRGFGDATLEFFFKAPEQDHHSIFWTRPNDTDADRFNITINPGGNLGSDYRDVNGALHPLVGGSGALDQWHHVAIVKDTTRGAPGHYYDMFVDGILTATQYDPNPNEPDPALMWTISGRSSYRFNGLIDEIRLTQRALTPEEFLIATPTPVANAGMDQTVDEGMLVTLNGTGSSGSSSLTFLWTQVAGPTVALSDPHSAQPTFTAPQVAMGGETLTFQLVVSAGQATSAPDYVNIVVTNINNPPVALAGDDQVVSENSPVMLDGSSSYDPDAEPLTYNWAQTGGPMVVLDLTDPVKPTFTAPSVGPLGESLTFELTVSDGIDSSTDSVTVQVENQNHDPVADAGTDQTRAEGALVSLDGSASSDPDGDPLSYSWVQVSGPAVLLTGDNTAAPSFTAPFVGAGGEELVFRLTVDDGLGGSASDEVTVTVQDANAQPDCSLARPSIAELWPPNHKMVPITIEGVTDPENQSVQITVLAVTQDEPLNGLGDGDTSPDAVIQGSTVLLRAERSGTGNGRVYQITFMADDGNGGTCEGSVNVTVPHSRGKNAEPAIDDGQLYDSTGN